MASSVGTMRKLCEKFTRKAINPELFREVLNKKAVEFSSRTGVLESYATRTSVADTQEYELPLDCLHVKDVIYDSYRAHKITRKQVKEMRDEV